MILLLYHFLNQSFMLLFVITIENSYKTETTDKHARVHTRASNYIRTCINYYQKQMIYMGKHCRTCGVVTISRALKKNSRWKSCNSIKF